MNTNFRFSLLIVLFVLFCSSAFAFSFRAEVQPIKDRITVDEVAEYEVTVYNDLDTKEEFLVKKSGYPFWDMYTVPLQNPISIIVPAESSASFRLFVDPLYITSVDTFTLDLGIALQRTEEEQKVPVTIGIKSIESLISGYKPTVLPSLSIDEEIDPRKEFSIKIGLNNQNVLDYKNLKIVLDSGLIKEIFNATLGPQEVKTIELSRKFDDMQLPSSDILTMTVFLNEKLIAGPVSSGFSVTEYSVLTEIPKQESFLKVRYGASVVSNNPDYKSTVKIPTGSLKMLFTTASPKAQTAIENGQKIFVWPVKLGNERKMEVKVTENYRPIPIIIALLIISIVLYFLFRSPMVVSKSVSNVTMKEGAISEAKIVVKVKNRSSKPLENIEVMDNVSHIAHVEKEVAVGSIQPHAILTHPKKGVIMKWKIESLEPGDERVLSYRMKSRLPILGEFNLPSASARANSGKNVVLANSNRVTVSA